MMKNLFVRGLLPRPSAGVSHAALFFSLLALAACARPGPKPLSGAEERAGPCTVTDTSGCPARPLKSQVAEKRAPSPHPQGEVTPFFESVPDGALSEEPGRDTVGEMIGRADDEETAEIIGEEAEQEIRASLPNFADTELVLNAQVEKWINYFQTRGREKFIEYLARSGRYVPMMRKILKENGLPEDLVYLAMIESGFKPYAYSRAKASGPWQFIRGTGHLYGLRQTWWIDERRDPEKSTIAAAQHLKDLYDQFNDWYLAAAGYNAGAGKIERAKKKYSTDDYWQMAQASGRCHRRAERRYCLRDETKDYVPKMLAAAFLAKDPKRYGFSDIAYEEALQYDTVSIPQPTELRVIAAEAGIPHSVLADLNPELRRDITPPDANNYELKVPKGLGPKILAAYPEIRKKSAAGARRHVVHRGETLASVARKYRVDTRTLVAFNKLRTTRLRPGTQLAIPVWGRAPSKGRVAPAVFEKLASEEGSATYRVRKGDTLWSISRRFNVSVAEIRRWNRLGQENAIRPGMKLRLVPREDVPTLEPAAAPPPPPGGSLAVPAKAEEAWKIHKVRRGESLWSISRLYGVSLSDLTKWNALNAGEPIYPGLELKVQAVNL